MIPIDYETDVAMLDVMFRQVSLVKPPDGKLMWIRNTLMLSEVECSAACLEQARARDNLEILTDVRPLPFDSDGFLCDEHMNQ
jgi:hypothetical protein